VLLDGIDLLNAQADLRARIGFVPQTAVLFGGTVAANIRYGREDASDDEVRHAAVVARALDFIGDAGQFASPVARAASACRAVRSSACLHGPSSGARRVNVRRQLPPSTSHRRRSARRTAAKPPTQCSSPATHQHGHAADRIVIPRRGRVVGIGTHAR
jgi:ATP-binding cassette subfamily B protein